MVQKALVSVVVGIALSLGAGCAPAMSTGPAPSAPKWETRKLARGVEIRISEDAGFEAQRVVDEVERGIRAREISAR